MKRTLQVIGILVAILILVIATLPLLVNANDFRPRIQAELTKALGREVKVGDLKLALLSGGVTAADLSIADDPAFSQSPFLRAKSLSVGVDLMPLIFSHKLNVTGITIEQPEIALLQSASGDWNFSGLGASSQARAAPAAASTSTASSSAGLDLSIKSVKIANGRVSLGKAKSSAQPLVFEKVNAEVRDFSAATVMPFTLTANFSGGGQLKIDGTAGPIHSGDVTLTPAKVSLNVSHLDLALAGVVDGATGMGGLISVDGSATSDGKTVDVTGKIKAEQLKLVKGGSPAKKPVEFEFALLHDLKARSGTLKRGDVHIGNAAASLIGTYTPKGEAPILSVTLSGPNMSIPELEAMLPALNVVLPAGSSLQGGTATVHLSVEGPVDQLVATGSLGVNKTTLAGFDMGSKLSALEKFAGMKGGPNTEIETLSTNVKASQAGGAALDNIKLVEPSIGELSGAGTISPANALDFKMTAIVHATGALAAAGKMPIPVAVKGTASNPVFQPDVKAAAAQEIKGLTGGAAKTATGVLGGLLGNKPKK